METPAAQYIDAPFADAINFFRKKVNLRTPTWRTIWEDCHLRAFSVAGAMKGDLLDDLRTAVDKGLAEGTTLREFRKSFDDIIDRTGWQYKGGRAWRTGVIFNTNLSVAYAAGHYRQMMAPAVLKTRPYWRYVPSMAAEPRPEHMAWYNLILPANDPFWQTHFPPNGWGCKCGVTAISQRELDQLKEEFSGTANPVRTRAPKIKTRPWKNKGTGKVYQVPEGVDPGWAYNPGKGGLDDWQPDLSAYPPGLRKIMAAALRRKPFIPPPPGTPPAAPPPPAPPKKARAPKKAKAPEIKTTKAAERYAKKQNIADQVDYGAIDPEAAVAWNAGIEDHLGRFPELRKNLQFIGSAQRRNKAYQAQILPGVRERVAKYYPNYTPAQVEKRAKSLARSTASSMGFARIGGNVWAQSTGMPGIKGITINEKWGKKAANWKIFLKANVETKFHPVGCDTIKSIVDHEMAHQVDSLLGIRTRADFTAIYNKAWKQGRQYITENLSGYACQNEAEFVAEAWAEYLNNPAPRPLAQSVGELIEDAYRSIIDL